MGSRLGQQRSEHAEETSTGEYGSSEAGGGTAGTGGGRASG